jgi:hypothetical protein
MEPCLNEPLNLCTKNHSRLSETEEESPAHRTDIDYDDVCLATSVSEVKENNCDKNIATKSTSTNGTTSSSPSQLDGDGTSTSFDSFIRPSTDNSLINDVTNFDWQSKEKNPNLLLQQQYFLLQQQQQQHQQQQQQQQNSLASSDGSMAKTHLDKYMKLTSRYLDTMSPFFQQFTPLMSQSASTSVQAAANAAASLLLTSNLNQQQTIPVGEKSPSPPPPPQENSDSNENLGANLINQDTVRFFLHKLIEHNFLQQIQQQQHLNDLINNNNNHPNTNNNHSNGSGLTNNFTKDKSPSSDADGDFFSSHHMLSPQNNHTKTFLDFLKNAAAAQSGINHTMSNQRNHQGFKRCEEKEKQKTILVQLIHY